MNNIKLKACFLWLLTIIIFVSSCSSEKKTTKYKIRTYTANHIMKEIESNEFQYDRLQAKLDVKFKDDKNTLGLKGQMRMQKDSVIWISLSLKVGIEIGRLMITPDSVKFLNRNNKTYLAESLKVFNDKLPIEPSIELFQDLFVGNITQINDNEKCRVTIDDERYKLEMVNKMLLEDIWVTPETFKIAKYRIKENNGNTRELQLEYSDFKSQGIDNGNMLPSKIIFELNTGSNICLEINYTNVIVNEDVAFPFNVTKKFDRIHLW